MNAVRQVFIEHCILMYVCAVRLWRIFHVDGQLQSALFVDDEPLYLHPNGPTEVTVRNILNQESKTAWYKVEKC